MTSDDPQSTSADAGGEAPYAGRSGRADCRASMRPEFLALFRDTQVSPPTPAGPAPAGGPGTAVDVSTLPSPAVPLPEPSRYLRRFLRGDSPVATAALSGLAGLDARLGGGFGYGLHLVLGPAGAGKIAFLDSLVWEAVAAGRPALYYALKTGALEVWQRLIATLGSILEGPAVTPAALRGRALLPQDVETLTRLDATLQASVLPYVSLIDPAPTFAFTVGAFIDDIRLRAREAGERHGRLPLVLLDDLHRLQDLTASPSGLPLLSRLNEALVADSLPGLFAGVRDDLSDPEASRLPVQTVLTLKTAPSGLPGRLDLEVRKNAVTGWTGTVPLLLDPVSGFFAECAGAE